MNRENTWNVGQLVAPRPFIDCLREMAANIAVLDPRLSREILKFSAKATLVGMGADAFLKSYNENEQGFARQAVGAIGGALGMKDIHGTLGKLAENHATHADQAMDWQNNIMSAIGQFRAQPSPA